MFKLKIIVDGHMKTLRDFYKHHMKIISSYLILKTIMETKLQIHENMRQSIQEWTK